MQNYHLNWLLGQAITVLCNLLDQVKHCVHVNWPLIYWGTLVQLSLINILGRIMFGLAHPFVSECFPLHWFFRIFVVPYKTDLSKLFSIKQLVV